MNRNKSFSESLGCDDDNEYEIGQDNVQIMGLDVHNPVFGISAFLIIMFVIGAAMFPAASNSLLSGLKSSAIDTFDWLFIIGGDIIVILCVGLIFLPLGKIRLGGKGAKPEHSTLSWLSMLFAAGMGIGLIFWSVAEPLGYYTAWYGTPLNVLPNTPEAAQMALGATMYHWGFHPWAVYGIVGVSLAFFYYNKGLPLTIRSALYPMLGKRIWGPAGHIIDIIAVLATMFGLATSLGFGAQQATSGLSYVFGIENTLSTQIIVIAAITAITLYSVYRGMNGGIKLLSAINLSIAVVLMLFVIVTGSIIGFFGNFGSIIVSYAENFIPLSNWIDRTDTTFLHGWTVFYWAWWISWSPFVGTFIARISRGRTVREFMIAVLFIPVLFTAVWMSAFGGNALDQAQAGIGELANGVGNASLTIYHMLAQLPLSSITSVLAIVLVMVFFITSADSGALVIDSITSGGKTTSPTIQRMFWAVTQSSIAAVLLIGGGADSLSALQSASVAMGLPFTVILVLMGVCIYMALYKEYKEKYSPAILKSASA